MLSPEEIAEKWITEHDHNKIIEHIRAYGEQERAEGHAQAIAGAAAWLEDEADDYHSGQCPEKARALIEAAAHFRSLSAPEAMKAAKAWRPTHRHYKGGLYRKISEACLESNLAPVVVYEAAGGTLWVRSAEEFNDHNRFAPLSEPPSQKEMGEALAAAEARAVLGWLEDNIELIAKVYCEDIRPAVPWSELSDADMERCYAFAQAVVAKASRQLASGKQEARKPNFIFDSDYWDQTYSYEDRNYLTEGLVGELWEPKEFRTLIYGPSLYAVEVVLSLDEEGDSDETEIQWFDTLEEARANSLEVKRAELQRRATEDGEDA